MKTGKRGSDKAFFYYIRNYKASGLQAACR